MPNFPETNFVFRLYSAKFNVSELFLIIGRHKTLPLLNKNSLRNWVDISDLKEIKLAMIL